MCECKYWDFDDAIELTHIQASSDSTKRHNRKPWWRSKKRRLLVTTTTPTSDFKRLTILASTKHCQKPVHAIKHHNELNYCEIGANKHKFKRQIGTYAINLLIWFILAFFFFFSIFIDHICLVCTFKLFNYIAFKKRKQEKKQTFKMI